MSPSVRYFTAFAIIATAAMFLVGAGELHRASAQAEERRAGLIARAAAWKAELHLEVDDGVEALRAFFQKAKDRVPGLQHLLVLQGARLFAHSDPKRSGQRLSQESVSDKEIYDRSVALKRVRDLNRDERERRPELTQSPYSELPWITGAGPRIIAAPVLGEGGYAALLELRLAPWTLPGALPWALLAVLLGAIGLFWGLSRVVPQRGALGAGALVFAAMIASESALLVDWRGELRVAAVEEHARVARALVEAGVMEGQDAEADPIPVLALDGFGAETGDLAALSLPPGAAPPPEWRAFGNGEEAVYFHQAFFTGARRADWRHLGVWSAGILLLALAGFALGLFGHLRRSSQALIEHRSAYFYMAPAIVGMMVLVFIPVGFGLVLGFMRRRYNVFEFAGLENYIAILTEGDLTSPQGFYYTLGVTVLWTGLNITFHVGIGLFLALLLNDTMLRARGLYRVILVVPWAVPNYITALIWKGMFNKEFGAVNFFMAALGLEPVSWFQSFWPAFTTNVVTNTWLGFPFMMLISLGALQSIPADLYEAATVDGASRWYRFAKITLPLLMPALVPAVIVGTIWTFNMFNIIYLVSGGAPDGATDILITDAFRWAFERDNYGYAAAYSTLIFLILLAFSTATNKITGATKGAYE